MNHDVVLEDGTVGFINDDNIDYQDLNDFIGEVITVYLYDENGNEIEKTGKLAKVLN